MHTTTGPPADDQEFLHWLFDRALENFEDGCGPSVGPLLIGREHLQNQVDDLLRRARQIAFGRQRAFPALRGYTILGELGRGGMGEVYLARQERLGGRPVALKVLPASVSLSPRARERFTSEANAIARLHHPNIVDIYDVIYESGLHAFAMEWVDGISLGALIEQLGTVRAARGTESAFEPRVADVASLLGTARETIHDTSYSVFICRIGVAIARALHAVHLAGLLHRDVKPSNILLRRDGTPLLSDFGLARDAESTAVTQSGQFVGTPAYAAPEQLRGDGSALDARTDVYGLGVTLYHALMLRQPFAGQNTGAILRQVEAGSAVPIRKINPRLPRDLQTIVGKAMDADPTRRYASADQLADDLDRLLSLQPIKARPAGMVTRGVKLMRRKRGVLVASIVSGIISLALASAAGVYFFLVPGWVRQHVDAARLALIGPSQNTQIWNAVYFASGRKTLKSKPELSSATVEEALRHYDAALRWRPGDSELRLEREAVQLARDLHSHFQPAKTPVVISDALRRRAPLTAEYAARWATDGFAPDIAPALLERAGPIDLRLLGLVAFLANDHETDMAAWSRLDLMTGPDPLVDGALGQLYLVSEQPARAYPRLHSAVQAFPDVGFLTVCLADAALQCGDVEKAEQLLRRARAEERGPQIAGWERVEADLHAAAGRDEQARRCYEPLYQNNSVAAYHYGRFLESRGDLGYAVRVYASGGHRNPGARRAFLSATEHYWAGLSAAGRWQFVRTMLDERILSPLDPYQPLMARAKSSLLTIVANYGGAWTAEHGGPSLDAKQQHSVDDDVSLITVSQRAGVAEERLSRDFYRWNIYPYFFKDLQASAILSRNVAGMSRFVGLAHCAWVRAEHVYRRLGGAMPVGAAGARHNRVEFLRVGDLPGGASASEVHAISGDGRTVVGSSFSNEGHAAFKWRAGEIMFVADARFDDPASDALGVNGDGTVIVGWSSIAGEQGRRPVRWEGGVRQTLPIPEEARTSGPDVIATAVSDDGRRVTGWVAIEPVCWEGMALVRLPRPPTTRGEPWCISGDGRVVGGMGGTNNAVVWPLAANQVVSLPNLDGSRLLSYAFGLSNEGRVIVGVNQAMSTRDHGIRAEACRWTSDKAHSLGDLPGGPYESAAFDVNADGRVIVGWGTSARCREACIWDESGTWVRGAAPLNPINLRDLLQDEYGLDLSGWVLTEARAISNDGRTIAGNGYKPDGNEEGWVAHLVDRTPSAAASR